MALPGGPQRDPSLKVLLRLGRPVAGSTLTCEHRRGQDPTEEQQHHAQGQTGRHPGRGASVASGREAPRTELLNFRAEGTRHQRAGEGFHQCKLCPPGTPCPPPTHEHTHSQAHRADCFPELWSSPTLREGKRKSFFPSLLLLSLSLCLSFSLSHTHTHTHACTHTRMHLGH